MVWFKFPPPLLLSLSTPPQAGASSSSSDSKLCTPSSTSDPPGTFSNNSTMLFHPGRRRKHFPLRRSRLTHPCRRYREGGDFVLRGCCQHRHSVLHYLLQPPEAGRPRSSSAAWWGDCRVPLQHRRRRVGVHQQRRGTRTSSHCARARWLRRHTQKCFNHTPQLDSSHGTNWHRPQLLNILWVSLLLVIRDFVRNGCP